MYLPYRTIGYVVDSSPVDVKRSGSEHFITASIGSSWQVYKASNLRCVFVAPEREQRIAAVASFGDVTFSAVGRQVIVWKRAHEITRITPPEGNRIVKLMVIGTTLITLSADRHIYTWDCSKLDVGIAVAQAQQAGASVDLHLNSGALSIDDVVAQRRRAQNDQQTKDDDGDDNITSQYATQHHTQQELTYHEKSLYNTIKLSPLTHVYIPLPPNSDPDCVITSWCHPPTYSNKIVLGWSTGDVELWNINSCKMIYRFTCLQQFAQNRSEGIKDNVSAFHTTSSTQASAQRKIQRQSTSAITVIATTPALDVVALGRQNGDIVLCNLKLDRVLHVFHQASGPVTALSFRTDEDYPQFVSTCTHGNITLWDLEKKQTIFIHKRAHGSAITSATFLPGEPILITSGRDNALYQWKFEAMTMHLLRSQCGHFAPPTSVRFYTPREILSGGQDKTLRYWSPMRDRSAFTLSWSNIKTKFTSDTAQLDGFIEKSMRHVQELEITPVLIDNVNVNAVTLTGTSDKAVLWSVENKRAEKLVGLGGSAAVKACFSYCGNFVFIAYHEGSVKKFNIESGIYRGTFSPSNKLTTSHSDRDLLKNKDKHLAGKKDELTGNRLLKGKNVMPHPSGVAGLFCTLANQSLISVGRDGQIYAWDIAQCAVQESIHLGVTITHATYANDLQLLAVVTSDSTICLIDTTRCIVVRKWTLKRRISCCRLYPLHGLLLVGDVTGALFTYDLASGALIDWSHFSLPITSIDVCPVTDGSHGSDLIATTHTGSLGIHLWVVNTSKQAIVVVPKTYTTISVGSSNVDHSDNQSLIDSIRSKSVDDDDDEDDEEDSDDIEAKRYRLVNAARSADCDVVFKDVVENAHLTSLSGVRSSRWKLLTQQRAIAQRNALHVKNALKQAQVPFFLNIKTGQKKREQDQVLPNQPLLDQPNAFALKDSAFKLDIGNTELLELANNIPIVNETIQDCYAHVKDEDDLDDSDDIFVSLTDPSGKSSNKNQAKDQKHTKVNKTTTSNSKPLMIIELDDDVESLNKDIDPTPYLMKSLSRSDHLALIPFTQYMLATSPAAIAAQITEFTNAKHVHAILHALYLIVIQTSSNLDAVSSILNYVLEQHSILISEHSGLRATCKLLLKVSDNQWKSVEQLLQSNIAVINHLCGMHSQL